MNDISNQSATEENTVEFPKKCRREDITIPAPNAQGNVWPKQVCPAFIPREGTPVGLQQCWYCCHADFHLGRPKALEVGVCYWPKKVIK